MTRTSRLTGAVALVVALVLGALGSAAVAVWTTTASGSGATRSATLLAPADLAVASSTTNPQTSLVVTWSAPTGQVPGATSYVVKRSSGGGAATTISCTTSSCTDTGLTPGTTYTYSVAATLHSWVSPSASASGSTAAAAATTTTSLASSGNPSVVGQLVTYTATVGSTGGTPTGNVAFAEGGSTIAGCGSQPLSAGEATCSVRYTATGARSVTASFAGSPGYLASASGTLSQQVNRAGTATTVSTAVSPARSGTPVTLTARVGALAPGSGTPTGAVAFRDGATTINGCGAQALNAAGEATCSATFTTTGAKSITAVYAGDAGFNGSTSGATTQRVTNGAVTGISFTNVRVAGTNRTTSCVGLGSASSSCTVSGTANNDTVTADVVFVSESGAATVYATDAASSVGWSATGKALPTSGTLSVASGATSSTSQGALAQKNGSNQVTITYTFTDAGKTYTATLTTG